LLKVFLIAFAIAVTAHCADTYAAATAVSVNFSLLL